MQSTNQERPRVDSERVFDPPLHEPARAGRPSIERQLPQVNSSSRTTSPEPQHTGTHSPRPLTPQQVAEFLGLDDKTITRWARKGYLPAHAMGEGKRKFWRFFEHELLAWLFEQPKTAEAA